MREEETQATGTRTKSEENDLRNAAQDWYRRVLSAEEPELTDKEIEEIVAVVRLEEFMVGTKKPSPRSRMKRKN
jgi:hypothetical protein